MSRAAISPVFVLVLVASVLDAPAAGQQYTLTVQPQAQTVAQASFMAMGGALPIPYQDSLATGTVTIYTSGTPVSYPITMKSKTLLETRSEVQMSNGTSVRIVNNGMGAIISPDGSVRHLYSNNTFCEHVDHIPVVSLLSEFANGNVNLLYQGTAQVQGQSEDVIEIDFVPDLSLASGSLMASMSRTLFFVNQTTRLVDKTQRSTFYEGDQDDTVNEEVYFTDYRPVNGLLVPFHQQVFIDGQLDADLTLSTAAINVGLPDSDFVLP